MYLLYFKDLFSILTFGLVLGMGVFMVLTILNQSKIQKWGRMTALFIFTGIAISALSAIRDRFAAPEAVFGLMSLQAIVCAAAGVLIILAGLISIFVKNQYVKKGILFALFALFVIQVLTVEISRPIIMV